MFESIWTAEERERGVKLFSDTYEALAEFSPLIVYGTLLGACRDGNLIPWDGDFDLMFPITIRDKLAFEPLYDLGYDVVPDLYDNFKVFPRAELGWGKDTTQHFRWPWVDLDFYEVRDKVHLLNTDGQTFYQCEYKEAFPTETVLFEGMRVSTFANPNLHLDRIYPNWRTDYQSPKVDHRSATPHSEIYERPIKESPQARRL